MSCSYEDSGSRIAQLRAKRESLKTYLKTIESKLLDRNKLLNVIKERLAIPQTGIRLNKQLSFRGVEKSVELFERLDEDRDGFINFEDFRAMTSIVSAHSQGIVHEPQYQQNEAWRLYMDDLGVRVGDNGFLDVKSFVKYRKIVEFESSGLSKHLEILGLGYLPRVQLRWQRLKSLIEDLYQYRQHIELRVDLGSALLVEDVSMLLADMGYYAALPDIVQSMVDRVYIEITTKNMRSKLLSLDYAVDIDNFTGLVDENFKPRPYLPVSIESLESLSREQLIAWFFSRAPIPRAASLCSRMFLAAKYSVISTYRRLSLAAKYLSDFATHFRIRKVFKDVRALQSILTAGHRSIFQFTAKLGVDDGTLQDGMGISWTFHKLHDREDFCFSMNLPRDCGCAFIVELAVHPEAEQQSVKSAADALAAFLRAHLDVELKKNRYFRGIFVSPASVSESKEMFTKVIRIAFAFRKVASADEILRFSFIPFKLHELFTDISGDLKFNTTLTALLMPHEDLEICDPNKKNASKPSSSQAEEGGGGIRGLTGRLFCRVAYLRKGVISCLHRAYIALISATSSSHIISPNTPLDPKTDAETLRDISVLDSIKSFIPYVCDWLAYLEHKVKGLLSAGITLKFNNIAELIERWSLLDVWAKQNLSPDIFSLDYGVCKLYEKWKADCSADLNDHFDRAKADLEASLTQVRAERARRLALSRQAADEEDAAATKSEQGRDRLLDKLRALGVTDVSAEDLDRQDNDKDLDQYMAKAREYHASREVQALVVYEQLRSLCLGIHSISIFSGQSQLRITCQSLEFVEFLPSAPPIQGIIAAVEKERRRLLG